MLHDELTLKERIRLEEARIRDEALRMLARAMKVYTTELVTIGDLTVRKP